MYFKMYINKTLLLCDKTSFIVVGSLNALVNFLNDFTFNQINKLT